nr:DUF1302 family protein [Alcanivorax sp. HI0083]
MDVKVSGSLIAGAIWTAENANPDYIFRRNAQVVGKSDLSMYNPKGGRNGDDGRLNYTGKELASTPVILNAKLEARFRNYKAVVAGKAWYDHHQLHHDVPFGSLANGYQANVPLDDSQYNRLARFNGLAFTEAYLEGKFSPFQKDLTIRAGEQYFKWGESLFFINGVNVINPFFTPAIRLSGDSKRLTTNAISASFSVTPATAMTMFYQLAWEDTVVAPCGTAFSSRDFIADGCNGARPVGPNDRVAYESGLFIERGNNIDARDGGQFGFSLSHDLGNTTLSAYLINIHSRRPYTSVITDSYSQPDDSGIAPGWRPPSDSSADADKNAQYVLEYPEDQQIYGVSFKSLAGQATRLFGEYSYRPNQPVQLATADLIAAFANDPAYLASVIGEDLTLGQDSINAAPGSVYQGYDRRKVSQLTLGVIQPVPGVLGSKALVVATEAGAKYIHDLPSQSERRYSRTDLYGSDLASGNAVGCQVAGQPDRGSTGCSKDGYASQFSWGYRLRSQLIYPNVVGAFTLKPFVLFGQDVKGWSYDANFSEGRLIGGAGISAEYGQRLTTDLRWISTGNDPFSATDRDFISASIALNF